LWKRKYLLQKFARGFSLLMEVCTFVRAVCKDGWNILNLGTPASKMSLEAVVLDQPQLKATRKEWMRLFNVRFEVFTAVTMKNGVFWVVTPCGSCKNRLFKIRGVRRWMQ
jgi:hypothetical protein